MNKTKVQCDNCPAVFIVQDNMFVRQVEDGIEEVGFTCPECGRETIAYKIDDEIKLLQKKVRKEREKAQRKIEAGVEPRKAERKLRQVARSLRHSMDRLNGRTPE